MAIIYVRSTDGSDADNGSTWALAKATLTGACAIDAAGDTIYLSQVHAESQAGAYTFANAGTNASPSYVICASDSAAPPTSSASSATIVSTGAGITFTGQAYYHGISFTSATSITVDTAVGGNTFFNCDFITTNTGTAGQFIANANNQINKIRFINCRFKFAGTANTFTLDGQTEFLNCSIISGSSTPSLVFGVGSSTGRGSFARIDNFDFSNFGTSFNLLNHASITSGTVRFRNCRMPSGWSGGLHSTRPANPGARGEMYASGIGADNSASLASEMTGTQTPVTVVHRNGTRALNSSGDEYSWSLALAATCSAPMRVFKTNEFAIWNDVTGSSRTVTVQVYADNEFGFYNSQVWLEVFYNGSASHPLQTMETSFPSDILGSASLLAGSSETWTDSTGGGTFPNPQQIAVTFTPQLAGFLTCRVCCGTTGTIYVDPDPVLS